MTAEQLVRNLLDRAIEDKLVVLNVMVEPPQLMGSNDLVDCVALIEDFLEERCREREDRWERAVGQCLESAESCAVDPVDELRKRGIKV